MTAPRTVTWTQMLTISSLFAGLSIYAINSAHKAEELAHKAEIIGLKARPNPYTSIDAYKDWGDHEKTHEVEFKLLTEKFQRGLETLPRPPKEVKKMLEELQRRLYTMETVVEECIKFESRIDRLEQARETR